MEESISRASSPPAAPEQVQYGIMITMISVHERLDAVPSWTTKLCLTFFQVKLQASVPGSCICL